VAAPATTWVIRGDREEGAAPQRMAVGRSWDATVDTSAYVPRVVREGTRLLTHRARAATVLDAASAGGTVSAVGSSR
jgi:hypothetical protein